MNFFFLKSQIQKFSCHSILSLSLSLYIYVHTHTYIYMYIYIFYTNPKSHTFLGGTVVKNPANAGDIRDVGSIPRLGKSSGEGNSNPLQYSCLENPMDREAWRASVHGVTESWIWLSNQTESHLQLSFGFIGMANFYPSVYSPSV